MILKAYNIKVLAVNRFEAERIASYIESVYAPVQTRVLSIHRAIIPLI